MMIGLLTRTLRVISLSGVFAFLFVLFVVPSRTFGQLFPPSMQTAVEKGLSFQSLLLFLIALTTLSAHCLFHFLKSKEAIVPFYKRTRFGQNGRLWGRINFLLSLTLFLATALSLNSPLDIDENIHALMMTRGDFVEELNPIKSEAKIFFTQNHVLAQAASIVSMLALGFEKIPYRLPALAFTLVLLLAVPLAHRRLFSTSGYSALLLFLGLNAFTFWYLHSARGYVSLMANTFLSFVIVLRALESERPLSPALLITYCVTLALSPFVHFFSMVFHLLVLLGLIFYGYLNRENLSAAVKRSITKLIFAHIAIVPLFLVVLAHNVIFLLRIGDFERGESLPLWSNLLKAMGFSFDWQLRAWIAAIALLGARFFLLDPSQLRKFPTVFLTTATFFFAGVLTLSDAKVFESRFVLPFLLPLAVLLVDAIHACFKPLLRREAAISTLLLFAFFVFLPTLSHPSVSKTMTLNLEDFDELIKVTRQLTAPVEDHCYFLTGKRDLGVFARDFYLRNAKEAVLAGEGKMSCTTFYQLRMEPSFDKPVQLAVPFQAKELWNNGRGMALYLHTRSSHFAKRTP